MNLLLIRHGLAGTREEWLKENLLSDNFRPLTKTGLVEFSRAVLGLESILKNIDIIYTSQLTRALQTAEILHGQYHRSQLVTDKHLNPQGNKRALIQSLTRLKKSEKPPKTIALVGHNPDIGILSNLLLGLDPKSCLFSYKKGSLALFDFSKNTAKLTWHMTQSQMAHQAEIAL